MPISRPLCPLKIVAGLHLIFAIAGSAIVLSTTPPSAEGQQRESVHRVATLGAAPSLDWDVFQRRLRELGYVEGRNLILESRWSNGYMDRVPSLLAELLRVKPDVLVADMFPSSDHIETAECVPILIVGVGEPYGACRAFPVARMSIASSAKEVSATHFRLARAAVPSASRFVVLTNSSNPFLVEYVAGLQAEAASAGVTVSALDVSGDSDLANLTRAIAREAPDVLIVGPAFISRPDARRQIVRFATGRGIPAVGSHLADGVMIAANYDWPALARRAADFVDQLLKGVKPADLPTGAPTKFDVVVDGRVARTLGLEIPQSVLSQADRVLD